MLTFFLKLGKYWPGATWQGQLAALGKRFMVPTFAFVSWMLRIETVLSSSPPLGRKGSLPRFLIGDQHLVVTVIGWPHYSPSCALTPPTLEPCELGPTERSEMWSLGVVTVKVQTGKEHRGVQMWMWLKPPGLCKAIMALGAAVAVHRC